MKYFFKKIPRIFKVGLLDNILIKDFGEIDLGEDEQITFLHVNNSRFDFAKKDWGFYATPSINGRLKNEGFKTALVKNGNGKIYIMAVHKTKQKSFKSYCERESQTVLDWLDEI